LEAWMASSRRAELMAARSGTQKWKWKLLLPPIYCCDSCSHWGLLTCAFWFDIWLQSRHAGNASALSPTCVCLRTTGRYTCGVTELCAGVMPRKMAGLQL
jgi:hypothetical protein